jgi:hypothetical protein
MSLVHSLLFTGIIFGWPSFSMLLQQDGAFLDERCNAECRRLALPCWPLPCAEDACCGCSVCGAEGACPWPPYQPTTSTLPTSCTQVQRDRGRPP